MQNNILNFNLNKWEIFPCFLHNLQFMGKYFPNNDPMLVIFFIYGFAELVLQLRPHSHQIMINVSELHYFWIMIAMLHT